MTSLSASLQGGANLTSLHQATAGIQWYTLASICIEQHQIAPIFTKNRLIDGFI